MTKPHSLRRKSKRITVRLKSETEEHLFGGFDDGAPPAAVSGGGGGGDLACLNDISTDLHHQAMRAERDAMVAAGLAPASLTDLEASNFFLHANGSGPNAGMGMVIDRGKEDARAHQRARSPLMQSNTNVEMKEYEAAKTPTYTRVTSKKDMPPPPPRQKSGSLERHSAARQKKETSPTKSQGGERHSHHPHHYHNHRHHHLQIYQPPQHQLTSVPPESPAAAVPVTSASADSLVGTVELHLDKSESVTNEKQGAKRRAAAAAAAAASSNRHEKEQSNKSTNDRRRHVRSNRRSHGSEFGENCGEIATAALLDATKVHKEPCENGGATDQVNHVIYQPK